MPNTTKTAPEMPERMIDLYQKWLSGDDKLSATAFRPASDGSARVFAGIEGFQAQVYSVPGYLAKKKRKTKVVAIDRRLPGQRMTPVQEAYTLSVEAG